METKVVKETSDVGGSRLPGFYKLSVDERHDAIARIASLTAEERYQLKREPLPLELAEGMIENVIGVFGIPLAVAVNFRINDRDVLVPMAVEEPSVVAAASHCAKLVRCHGRLRAEADDPVMIGQVQIVGMPNPEEAERRIAASRERLLQIANEQDAVLRELGGGARDVETRVISTNRGPMIIVHLIVDVRDAMGANAVNTMAEAVALFLEGLTGGRVGLRILSNLADRRRARATLEISPSAFDTEEWKGEDVVERILDASAFAEADPYRAATHNKGIMNGVDAVMIATGNDWRAVEAGAHAWAAHSGMYRPLSRWRRTPEGRLRGEIELPLAAGIVGGATKAHPLARIALKIMGVRTARELAEIATAVGLVQNLAALRSLVTDGIQRGHMVLHARNVALSAGAVGEMAHQVARQMVREGRIRFDRARQLVRQMLRSAHQRVHDLEHHVRKDTEDIARKSEGQDTAAAPEDDPT